MDAVIMSLASESSVVIFSKTSCCFCYAVKTLFSDLAVRIVVHELDQEPKGREMERSLTRLLGRNNPAVPAVFIGGNLVGSTDAVMTLHLSGQLVPLLRGAGAIWL